MGGVKDLFFDEFYFELERVAGEIAAREKEEPKHSVLFDELRGHWVQYAGDGERDVVDIGR